VIRPIRQAHGPEALEGQAHHPEHGRRTDGGSPVESRSILHRGGEAAALPFGRTRGFKPCVRSNLISPLTSDTFLNAGDPRGSAPSTVSGPVPRWLRRELGRSKDGYSHSPGQNATSPFVCPRSSGLVPRSPDGTLLMNSLLIPHNHPMHKEHNKI